MHAEIRDFIHKVAEPLGWRFDSYLNNGHIGLVHESGKHYQLPSTPSTRWWVRTNLQELERISGRKLPRANAGHYKRVKVEPLVTRLTPMERQACTEADELVAEAEMLRERLATLAISPCRKDVQRAVPIVQRYAEIEAALEQYHRVIPRINAVERKAS